jgi:type I restriction-modification system DNA methylase subunit
MAKNTTKIEGNKLSAALQKSLEINKRIEALLDSDKVLTDADIELLKQYSGYGGLVADSEKDSNVLFEYYTPLEIVQKMWQLAIHHKPELATGVHYALEPSCGTGVFISEGSKINPQVDFTGFEINPYAAKIAKLLNIYANIEQKPFEQMFIKNNASVKAKVEPIYDLVIGNPPYGKFNSKEKGLGEGDYTLAKNYIDYFIFRGVDVLKPGGLLVYVVGAEVANGAKLFLEQMTATKTKKHLAEVATLVDAYKMGNGLFPRTDVLTEILVFKKN